MFPRACVSTLLLATLQACGTYSLLRPADTLKSGVVEFAGGAAYGGSAEVVNPVVQIGAGVTDWLEFDAQYEGKSGFTGFRFGLLASRFSPIALAIGVGGGVETFADTTGEQGAGLLTLTIGHDFGRVEPYLGVRHAALFEDPSATYVSSLKGGLRVNFARYSLTIEGGRTAYRGGEARNASLELAAGIAFKFL